MNMDLMDSSSTVLVQVMPQEIREKYFPGLLSLGILRLDLPDPVAGGNKRYKLKYNLSDFRLNGKSSILTFGGAYSNHIAATAEVCARESIPCIGIIRGEELNYSSNRVLEFAHSRGMKLHFVTRQEYRRRNEINFHSELQRNFGNVHVIPEGGSNSHAVKGCMEILGSECAGYDEIYCPVGTGATAAGLILAAKANQKVVGIAILEGEDYVLGLVKSFLTKNFHGAKWEVDSKYTLGGYAKSSIAETAFIKEMFIQARLPLDHVYSGKTLFAIHKMAVNRELDDRKVLFIHTGGYAFSREE